SVVQVSTDRYQRLVGRVFLDGRNINAEMVADGAAWVYRKYSDDPELLELERQAREQGRGLWALQEDQRVAPWEWRRR
ncbi:MAG: thermonuclease family protein, partial [Gammaproteobacteria bacterium]|nr:thermonuclease family protein [Gammaproteobacteria bacterium]